MIDGSQEFKPLNDLESALFRAQTGNLKIPEFFEKLVDSQVFMLLDKDVDDSGVWDNSASPMVLTNKTGTPVLALFTAPQRADEWPTREPRFSYGLLTDFTWLLRGVQPGQGIVLNPGHPVGCELTPDRVAEMAANVMSNK